MLIFMKTGSTREDADRVLGVAEDLGHRAEEIQLEGRTAVRVSSAGDAPPAGLFDRLAGVEVVLPVSRLPRHSLRRGDSETPAISIGSRKIGGGGFVVVAGPCAVESEDQLMTAARAVAEGGADFLRGGAYKPRTSPYAFQGHGERALRLLARARHETGLPVVTEAVDAASLEEVERYGDVIQIGARNMQNFELLKRASKSRLPVLLKRGISANLEELLMSAEYVLDGGNEHVILCERGIRTFSNHSRYTLDLSIVPVLKQRTRLPVIVDPSHACGTRESVAPLARAALAAGADGVMIEVHPDPSRALCDGPQSLLPGEFKALVASLRELAPLVDRQRETVS